MSKASTAELLMVDLVNGERAKAGLEPLSVNDNLNTSSEVHSRWMLQEDIFDHTGANGSNAGQRIEQAGYKFEGSSAWAENIGWQSERGAPGIEDDVRQIHESLMNSPSHRANILDPNLKEIGIGVEEGKFTSGNGEFDSVMVTQNFGKTDAPATAVMASQSNPSPDPAMPAAPGTEAALSETPTQQTTDTQTALTMPPEQSVQADTTSAEQSTVDAWAFATSAGDGQQSSDASSNCAFDSSDGMGSIMLTQIADMATENIADIQADFDSLVASLGTDPIMVDDGPCLI